MLLLNTRVKRDGLSPFIIGTL